LGLAGVAVSASGGGVVAGTLDVPFPGAGARVTALDASGAMVRSQDVQQTGGGANWSK
jgi:hypothetical protein